MAWRAHRYAPAVGTLLCRADAVTDGGCSELRYGSGDGAFSLLLYRRGAEVRAYVNNCPHFSLPLNVRPNEFLMLAGAQVMCVYHCAVFRLEDGHCVAGPAHGMSLESVPLDIIDAQIFIGAG